MRILMILAVVTFSSLIHAQNLFDLAIREIEPQKKSVYFSDGVLHLSKGARGSELINIRHSYSPQRGYERIVFDFNTNTVPRIYAYIANENKKVFFDFFESSFSSSIPDLKNVHTVRGIDFFAIDEKNFSAEINFKQEATFEIFYLSNPGRLVIDVKK